MKDSRRRGRPAVGALCTPREIAEAYTGHAQEARSANVLDNLERYMRKACAIWRDAKLPDDERRQFGLEHVKGPTGRIGIPRKAGLEFCARTHPHIAWRTEEALNGRR